MAIPLRRNLCDISCTNLAPTSCFESSVTCLDSGTWHDTSQVLANRTAAKYLTFPSWNSTCICSSKGTRDTIPVIASHFLGSSLPVEKHACHPLSVQTCATCAC